MITHRGPVSSLARLRTRQARRQFCFIISTGLIDHLRGQTNSPPEICPTYIDAKEKGWRDKFLVAEDCVSKNCTAQICIYELCASKNCTAQICIVKLSFAEIDEGKVGPTKGAIGKLCKREISVGDIRREEIDKRQQHFNEFSTKSLRPGKICVTTLRKTEFRVTDFCTSEVGVRNIAFSEVTKIQLCPTSAPGPSRAYIHAAQRRTAKSYSAHIHPLGIQNFDGTTDSDFSYYVCSIVWPSPSCAVSFAKSDSVSSDPWLALVCRDLGNQRPSLVFSFNLPILKIVPESNDRGDYRNGDNRAPYKNQGRVRIPPAPDQFCSSIDPDFRARNPVVELRLICGELLRLFRASRSSPAAWLKAITRLRSGLYRHSRILSRRPLVVEALS